MTRTPTVLVLASGNEGKLQELREALFDRPFTLRSAAEASVHDFPAEDGDSYEANALIKAAHIATRTGLAALADDSGLEVDALDGAPGLHSARFGGPGLSDGERIAHLLAKLRGVPPERRGARFVSVIALAVPNGRVRTFEGRCEGRILAGPRGVGGFGYDPVFHSFDLDLSFGQADARAKARVSHRGRALAAFLRWLDGPEADEVLNTTAPNDPLA